jgi:hypothetical protein
LALAVYLKGRILADVGFLRIIRGLVEQVTTRKGQPSRNDYKRMSQKRITKIDEKLVFLKSIPSKNLTLQSSFFYVMMKPSQVIAFGQFSSLKTVKTAPTLELA